MGRLWRGSGSIRFLPKELTMLEISFGLLVIYSAESQKSTILQLIFDRNQSKVTGMVQGCMLISLMVSWEQLEIKKSSQKFVKNLGKTFNSISMCMAQIMTNVLPVNMRLKVLINSAMGFQIVEPRFVSQLLHGKKAIKEDWKTDVRPRMHVHTK